MISRRLQFFSLLLTVVTFQSSQAHAQVFDCFDSTNVNTVGPVGAAECAGMLIVDRNMLLNATFSGADAFITSAGGINHFFGGANGGVFTGQVTNFNSIFENKTAFNADIDSWDTSRATSMRAMFRGATNFNQSIDSWDVRNVTTMENMFREATSFNQDLNSWNTSALSTMRIMFHRATSFNGAVGNWDVSRVSNFQSVFSGATVFNRDISSWNVSSGTSFKLMFTDARAFNQSLDGWSMANATNLEKMFFRATAFNQNLNSWNTSKVSNLHRTFAGARIFNGNISSWNTSALRSLRRTFDGASAFNQNIGGWDVSNVTNFVRAFKNAVAFDQDLTQWDVAHQATEPLVFAPKLNRAKHPCWGFSSCPSTLNLSATSPADGAFGVSLNSNLTFTFDRAVFSSNAGGNIRLFESDDTLVTTFNVKNSSHVSISGSQATVSMALDANTDYYVQIDAGSLSAINNGTTQLFSGITNKTDLNFSTRASDTIAPTLVSTSPADDATNVGVTNPTLTLTFSEDIAIGAGDISIFDQSTDALVKAYDVTDSNFTSLSNSDSLEVSLVDNTGATILSPTTNYYVLIDSGIVEDASSNQFSGVADKTAVNFTTQSTNCGRISGITKKRNGRPITNVAVRLLDSSGSVLTTANTDANGFYELFPPSVGTFRVEFSPSSGRPLKGQSGADAERVSGRFIENIEITDACDDVDSVDGLLIDPAGVVYDAVTRAPVKDAVVELLLDGAVVDDSILDSSGGPATQTTGDDGAYSFIFKADVAPTGTYELRVTPPSGFRFESTSIPANTGIFTSALGGGVEAIQAQDTAPAVGDITTYHLFFAFTFTGVSSTTSNGVINNHIPIDPITNNEQDLIDAISTPLKAIIERNMAHNVVSRMASISNLVSDSINRIGSEIKTVQAYSHNGIYSNPQSFFDAFDKKQVAGDISSDSKRVNSKYRVIDRFSYFFSSVDNLGVQRSANYLRVLEQTLNSSRLRGFIIGGSYQESSITNQAVGEIKTDGLMVGLYETDKSDSLVTSIYSLIAIDRSDFDLEFGVTSLNNGGIRGAGEHSYKTFHTGISLSTERVFRDLSLQPKLKMDVALVDADSIDVVASQGSIRQTGEVTVDSFAAKRLSGELPVKYRLGVALKNGQNASGEIQVAPRLFCQDDTGVIDNLCGFGGRLSLLLENSYGTSMLFATDAEDMNGSQRIDLTIEMKHVIRSSGLEYKAGVLTSESRDPMFTFAMVMNF